MAFVVIAGDLYDGDWRDFSTGLFFAEQVRRLQRPCLLLRGNHDARSVITRGLRPPPNVHEFSSRTCETIRLAELRVALHGHIHARRVLAERPWIVFPGNLQGRHSKETGAKGCTLVTVEDGRVVAVEHRTVDVLRWAALEVDATGLDVATLTGRITQTVHEAIDEADGRPVLARVTLTGATALHGTLLGDAEHLAAECRNAAIEAGGMLWPESVRVRTRPVPQTPGARMVGQWDDVYPLTSRRS